MTEGDPVQIQVDTTELREIRKRGVRRGMNLPVSGLEYDLREIIPDLSDNSTGRTFLDGYSKGLAARILGLTEIQTVHRLKEDLTPVETRVLGEYETAVLKFLRASQSAGRQLGTIRDLIGYSIANLDRSKSLPL